MPGKSSKLSACWPYPVPRTIEEARKTYEGRVAWALEYKHICTYADHEEVGFPAMELSKNRSFSEIECYQRAYDHFYRKTKEAIRKGRVMVKERKMVLEAGEWVVKLLERVEDFEDGKIFKSVIACFFFFAFFFFS